MKIAILSCFYPYRGGIAQFNANIYNELSKTHQVKAFNFKRQYPNFLFPGKTQFVEEGDSAIKIESEAILDTANPLSYLSSANAIKQWNPDLLIMRYWMSYFAPSQGYIGRALMKRGCKVISIVDNLIPHEPRFFDKPFTKYYLNSNSGYITLSESVKDDLISLKPDSDVIVSPHPVYNHFGDKVERGAACRELNLDPRAKNILFFGLIREYKGLDILIETFGMLEGDYNLIIAGEPYEDFDYYQSIIDTIPNKDRVRLFTRYISDLEVPLFFSAADVCILPYRTATQSGIGAVASHFLTPLITTDVGGLKETIEGAGTGIVVAKPQPALLKEAIENFFGNNMAPGMEENIRKENYRLSWSNFCNNLIEFYHTL